MRHCFPMTTGRREGIIIVTNGVAKIRIMFCTTLVGYNNDKREAEEAVVGFYYYFLVFY